MSKLYYVRYEKYSVIIDTDCLFMDGGFTFINRLYQLVVINNEEKLVRQFDKNDSSTFRLQNSNGELYLNITKAEEIIGLNHIPDYPVMSFEEYNKILTTKIKETEKNNQEQQTKNKY